MSRVYWDSMLFIYLAEHNPEYQPRIMRLLEAMNLRDDSLCTSIFTLGEVLTGAYAEGALSFAEEIKRVIAAPFVELLPFTADTADRYARIRAANKVRPADAIHLATAASTGVDLFLTNDHALQRMIVPGIQFVAGIDVDLF
jgi:predicted nucleic acid-binding protein